jgi:transcriptional regulator with XRE-family HTH domain
MGRMLRHNDRMPTASTAPSAVHVTLPRLVRERQRQALSQRDLAQQAGVSETTIRRIEHGLLDPRPSTIRKLAKALRVMPASLMRPVESSVLRAEARQSRTRQCAPTTTLEGPCRTPASPRIN